MFDLFRVATLAALSLGVAMAPGPFVGGAPVETASLPPVPVTVPLENSVTPAPVDPVAAPPIVEDQPVADSIAGLVRRHSASVAGDADMECLAGAVYFEAKGEPLEGQLAVARVILNRMNSGRFPATACGVIRQRGQFSFVRGEGMPAVPRNSVAWHQAVAIAHVAANDLWTCPADRALYFHARSVAPRWRMVRVGAVGNHVFYR